MNKNADHTTSFTIFFIKSDEGNEIVTEFWVPANQGVSMRF